MLTTEKFLALRPIFSETFLLKKENPLFTNDVYIYRITSEERTSTSPEYLNNPNRWLIEILEETQESFIYFYNGSRHFVNIINETDVKNFLVSINIGKIIYLDITGLSHNTWAVLLKVSFTLDLQIKVIYSEPLTYNSPTNKPHSYDLSIKLSPIKPIPGFAVLTSVGTSNFSFIPLLGFERRRFELMITNVDPPQRSIFPIVGVPGFQLPFPFETYFVNKKKLIENEIHQNIRFAAASCPFRLYYLLYDLALEAKSELYKIALIGTKPHALGAVLFYLCSGLSVELLYDHPERKIGRSSGAFKLHVYHVDKFRKFLDE